MTSDGTISANAYSKGTTTCGIYSYYDAEFSGKVDVEAKTDSTSAAALAIYSDALTIDDCTMNAKVTCASSSCSSTYSAIYACAETAIKDSEINMETNTGRAGIFSSSDIDITTSKLNVVNSCTSNDSYGLLAGTISIDDETSFYITGNTAAIVATDDLSSSYELVISEGVICFGDVDFDTAPSELAEVIDTVLGGHNVATLAIGNEVAKTVCTGEQDYEIIKGANQEVVFEAGKDFTVTSNAPYALYEYTSIDGEMVPEEYVTVKEGSTIVTVKAAYMDNLDTGKHTIKIVSSNGDAETTFTVVTPHTDAAITYALASVLIVFTLFGGNFIVIKKRAELN